MRKLYFLPLLLLFTACEEASDCCSVVDTSLDIKYSDVNGGNWLNQQGLHEGNITVYFMKEGRKEKVHRGHLDTPKMFSIYRNASDQEILRLFPSDYIENGKSYTLIEFSATDVDTVVCLFNTSNSSIIGEEVWYNGKSVWNIDQSSPRAIEVIKQ